MVILISKETLAPVHFETLRNAHRTNAGALVPQIIFCLFLCRGIRRSIHIEQIA